MRLRNSLSSKYLFLIFMAMMIFPITFPVISILVYGPLTSMDSELPNVYQNGEDLEDMWHAEAKKLTGKTDTEIIQTLTKLKSTYSKANIFWVNEQGILQKKLPDTIEIPSRWTTSYTVEFMKTSYGGDPFTIVAFIGETKSRGFMVFQIPRSDMQSTGEIIRERYDYIMIIGTLLILGTFVFLSWIFFYKIKKRLLRLQEAMANPAESGIPEPLVVDKSDEIGQLIQSFNSMVHQLEESRKREKEEEDLRRQLIANLSHDLRTPLTTIRGHAYSLKKEDLSEKGQESLELIDTKINYLGQLIDNLLSYTLLSSKKYPFEPTKTDIIRIVRLTAASWYPVFEKENFTIELDIPDDSIFWMVDPKWFERILDNLFQNINRHAKSGRFVSISVKKVEHTAQITIEDKGPGMQSESTGKGAGIGLSIVSLMTKEMNIKWDIHTTKHGTKMVLSASNVD
ncbi:histidine kinase dimerization/phospho-acceptor domain-containing protein [Fredinandcohnia humi]